MSLYLFESVYMNATIKHSQEFARSSKFCAQIYNSTQHLLHFGRILGSNITELSLQI